MPTLRALSVVVTALVLAASPLFVQGAGTPDRGGAAYAAVASSPLLDNGNDNDADGAENDNTDEFEIEGQVLAVQCPAVRGQTEDRGVAAACANVAEGVVIPAINLGSNPPDIYVHNVDGAVRVIFNNAADVPSVNEGDYVRIDGRRITEFLFEARGSDVEVDDDGDDNGDDGDNGNDNDDGDNGNDNDDGDNANDNDDGDNDNDDNDNDDNDNDDNDNN